MFRKWIQWYSVIDWGMREKKMWGLTPSQGLSTEWGKSRFTGLSMEKDMQIIIIIALFTHPQNVTMAQS